jgi:hypothetical protein
MPKIIFVFKMMICFSLPFLPYHLLLNFTLKLSLQLGWFIFDNCTILLATFRNGYVWNTLCDAYVYFIVIITCNLHTIKSYYALYLQRHRFSHKVPHPLNSTILYTFPECHWIHSTNFIINTYKKNQRYVFYYLTSKGIVQTWVILK